MERTPSSCGSAHARHLPLQRVASLAREKRPRHAYPLGGGDVGGGKDHAKVALLCAHPHAAQLAERLAVKLARHGVTIVLDPARLPPDDGAVGDGAEEGGRHAAVAKLGERGHGQLAGDAPGELSGMRVEVNDGRARHGARPLRDDVLFPPQGRLHGGTRTGGGDGAEKTGEEGAAREGIAAAAALRHQTLVTMEDGSSASARSSARASSGSWSWLEAKMRHCATLPGRYFRISVRGSMETLRVLESYT